jgi:hypothetical protein
MDANLTPKGAETNPRDRRQTPEEETQQMVEALKSCLQTSLVGESQNFRSTVAAAIRGLRHQQAMALAITALACLLSAAVLLGGMWEGRRITRQADARLQALQKQAALDADPFAELRRANWQPAGQLITQKGRTFIELKPAR